MIRQFHFLWALLGVHVPISLSLRARRSMFYRLVCWLLRYVYSFVVFILISFQCASIIYQIAQTPRWHLGAPLAFSLIGPLQYIFLRRYVGSRHFEIVVSDVQCVRLSSDRRYAYFPSATTCLSLVFGLAAVSTLLQTLWQAIEPTLVLPAVLTENRLVFVVLCAIYRNLTLCTNVLQFNFVFAKQLCDFGPVLRQIQALYWHSGTLNLRQTGLTVNTLRVNLNEAIERLESTYVSMAVCGALAIGIVTHTQSLDAYLIAQLVAYAFLQICFLTLVYLISKRRSDLKKPLQSPAILNKQWRSIEQNTALPSQPRSRSAQSDAAEKIAPRSVLTYDDLVYCHQQRALRTALTSASQSDSQSEPSNSDDELPIDVMIDAETLTLLHRIDTKMDWSIIMELLERPWNEFSFLGFNFSDSSMIMKTAGLISSLVIFGNFISSRW